MEKCRRSGCSGDIQEGFCADCGLAPVGVSVIATLTTSSKVGPVLSGSASVPGSTPSSSQTGSRGRTATKKSTGRTLGAGFVSLPPLPSLNPLQKVLADPNVPEKKRFCGSCKNRVTRISGFCSSCGQPYSFAPTLKAGDLVGGQYEVKGPIPYGAPGWIYLAPDTRLQQRLVLPKVLLNSK